MAGQTAASGSVTALMLVTCQRANKDSAPQAAQKEMTSSQGTADFD
jgi:hypothetical protein